MFQIGDQVILVGAFLCDGDGADIDQGFDKRLRGEDRAYQPTGVVARGGSSSPRPYVEWTCVDGQALHLYTNEDRLAPILTDEDVDAAVQSIMNRQTLGN